MKFVKSVDYAPSANARLKFKFELQRNQTNNSPYPKRL